VALANDGGTRRKRLVLVAIGLAVLAIIIGFALTQRGADAPAAPATSATAQLDIAGKPIIGAGPFTRIAIDDSRYLVALGLIHPEPASLLVAWPQDVNRLGEETYQQFLAQSPGVADLPKVASSAGNFDAEALLAAAPDLALLSLESGITDAQRAQLEGAGITVVVVDFFVNPFENLEPSLRLLGQLTGREQQAEDFLAFRAQHMKVIADRVATLPAADRPSVFLEPHAGMSADCCNSPGRGNIGDYLAFVGGRNIGAEVITQASGKLNLEYVIAQDPQVYIATGGPHLAQAGGLVVGPGFTAAQAQAALAKVAARPGISGLTAVREGRTHGFSHQLINSPLDVVAVETFARWIHPELFADLTPEDTLAEINTRFLAVPYEGTWWVDAN
jgi:iron complex transport system substrate-binding protein